MNFYKLHSKPEILDHYATAFEKVSRLVWEKYSNQPEELKKRKQALAKDPKSALYYAQNILEGPFPAGEAAIAKNSHHAYYYARYILKEPFPAGEAAIATEAIWAYWYAKETLKGPFRAAEAALASNAGWAYHYAKFVLKGPFPAGEAAITKNSYWAPIYAQDFNVQVKIKINRFDAPVKLMRQLLTFFV